MSNVLKSFQVDLGMPFKMVQPRVEHMILKKETPKEKTDKYDDGFQVGEDAKLKAQKCIQNAQVEAEKILKDAKLEIEQMRLQILEEARIEGYNQGYEEIKTQAEHLLQEAEKVKSDAQEEYYALLDSAEKDIVDIILNIARKVIGEELESNPQAIVSLVKDTIKKCKNSEKVILRISPEDFDMIHEKKDQILKASGFSGELQIKKDIALHRGGCVAETPTGNIDASVDTQLNAIEQAFYGLLNTNNQGKDSM